MSGDDLTAAGPALWRYWRRTHSDGENRPSKPDREISFYSDSRFTARLIRPDWPIDLIPSMPHPRPGDLSFALVARWRPGSPGEEPKTPTRTDESAFHGGSLYDEIAAVVALIYGVRCRSGGHTRIWIEPHGAEWDALGQPIEADHRPPAWTPPLSRVSALPNIPKQVTITDGDKLLSTIPMLQPEQAIALIRAARLYANALWIADDDGNLAWLQLVGAIEVAANSRPVNSVLTPEEQLSAAWPEMMELVAAGGSPEYATKMAALLVPLVKSTAKFLQFLSDFKPSAPLQRPQFGQVDWEHLKSVLSKVYAYRSRALHQGIPFPTPMCEPPYVHEDGVPCERPIWEAVGSGGQAWLERDLPIHLHTFADITREALLAWWSQLVPSESASDAQ